jgi:hypothetical protein
MKIYVLFIIIVQTAKAIYHWFKLMNKYVSK